MAMQYFSNVGRTSFLIPARDMPQQKAQELVMRTADRMLAEAVNKGLAPIESLVIRDIRPDDDLNLDYDTDAGAEPVWATRVLVAETAWNYLNTANATPQLDTRRLVGFYGVSIQDTAPVCTRLEFLEGVTGITGKASFDLTILWEEQAKVGYFSEPVIFAPNQFVFIRLWPQRAKAFIPGIGAELLTLKGLTIESVGPVISKE